jgi:hypothetical protein
MGALRRSMLQENKETWSEAPIWGLGVSTIKGFLRDGWFLKNTSSSL